MSATSPQQEGPAGPVLGKWLLFCGLLVAIAVGLVMLGTDKLVAASLPSADFLATNKERHGVITTSSGLQYEILREGQGEHPLPTDTVAVMYEGKLTDGTVFDSSYQRGQPAIFPLNGVIPGWTEGVQLMKPGAKFRFVVPSDLGYGPTGAGGVIPPNAVLQFDVELLAIKPRQ